MYQGAEPSYSVQDSTEYVAALSEEARKHRALHHPYLRALTAGEFPDPSVALKDFTFQYLAYSTDFLRYLTATIAQVEERVHREMLMHNLIEEAGRVEESQIGELAAAGIDIEWIQGVPHPALYMRFLDSVGVDKEFRDRTPFCDEAITWRRTFSTICFSGGAAQALGAMGLGTENIVKYVYGDIIRAIERFLPGTRRDRVFFDLHAAVDDEHGEVIDDIAIEYARYRRNREPLRAGMLMALNIRAAFFDGMMIRSAKIKDVGQQIDL